MTYFIARGTILKVHNLIGIKAPGVVDKAIRFYKLALEYGMTYGRKQDIVAACCLYAVYRNENLPGFLIQLS